MDGVTGDAAPPVAISTVSATLNYLRPGSKRNRLYVAPGGHLTTTEYAPTTVTIANGRPHTDGFGLDRTGFTLLRHTSAVDDFGDPAQLDGMYRAEAGELVRQALGADEIVTLGWVIRRASQALDGAQPPASDVHVDIHPGRTHDRMSAASPRGEPYKRAVMTSLWRAFSPPPQDWPLALLDYRSVDDTEGEPNLLLFVDTLPDPDNVPEIEDPDARPAGSIFAPRPQHRWWFFPDLTADEALLFKLHDTDHSVAWRVPHTAFETPYAAAANPRESVEFRTIAFFY
ncbi:MAG TPA: CmcJ/NvfI family oxidoreductase [Trebonia sp.]